MREHSTSRSRRLIVTGALLPALAAVIALHALAPAQAAEGEHCPNEQLRQESSLNPDTNVPYSIELPECRAYEMVSPSYKEGQAIESIKGVSGDGTHVVAQTIGVFASAADTEEFGPYYEFTRTPLGWQAMALDPSAVQYPGGTLQDVSRAFTTTLWSLRKTIEAKGASSYYLRKATSTGGSCPPGAIAVADACFEAVGPQFPPSSVIGEPPDGAGETTSNGYLGASADLSHIVFENYGRRNWPGDPTIGTGTRSGTTNSLYEYIGTGDSEPILVGIKPGPKEAQDQPAQEPELVSECGTGLGLVGENGNEQDTYNAISMSGATVFFTARAANQGPSKDKCRYETNGGSTVEEGIGPPVSELYVRLAGEKTVAISEPILPGGASGECSGGESCDGAALQEGVFQGASEDGERVFFLSEQPLVNGASATGEKLYEERLEGGRVTEVLDVSNLGANAGVNPEVQGVVRVSEDGSHIYFVAEGVLTTKPSPDAQGDNALGESVTSDAVAQPGADNLYVYDPTTGLAFVGDLSPQDAVDWGVIDKRPVQATPNGEFLAFQSAADLTLDDTSTVAQAFEYDAATGELTRVSIGACPQSKTICGPDERLKADGNTNAAPVILKAPIFSGSSSPVAYQTTRSLSEDGAYVVFESADGLTMSATAGRPDVYEYHWAGGALSDGNVSLLANGLAENRPDESAEGGKRAVTFVSVDGSGEDVFIKDPLGLVGQDTDTQQDVYDARIDGGFPAPVFFAECSGEACQGAPEAPPSLPTTGSAGTPAVGNLVPGAAIFPSVEEPKPKPKPLTRAQKLARALKACATDKSKSKRKSCQKAARRRYGSKKRKAKRDRRSSSGARGRPVDT